MQKCFFATPVSNTKTCLRGKSAFEKSSPSTFFKSCIHVMNLYHSSLPHAPGHFNPTQDIFLKIWIQKHPKGQVQEVQISTLQIFWRIVIALPSSTTEQNGRTNKPRLTSIRQSMYSIVLSHESTCVCILISRIFALWCIILVQYSGMIPVIH